MQSVQPAIGSPASEPAPAKTQAPARVIRPGRSDSLLNLKEIWLYRDLILALAVRDIKLRYKQTVLGALWVVIQPLLAAGIFSIIFNGIAGLKTDAGVPPFVYVFSGMLIWTVFSGVVGKTSNIMVGNSALVSKVYFPRIVLPLSVLPSILVDLCVSLLVLAGLMLALQVPPTPLFFLWPVALLIAMILALGIGLISASLAVSYRDIPQILPVLIGLLMYASPIPYSISEVKDADINPLIEQLYFLNPLVEILGFSRYLLLGVGQFSAQGLAIATGVSFGVFLLGLWCFRALERRFADVI